MAKKFKSIVLSVVSCCLASLIAWSGFSIPVTSWANAASLNSPHYLMNTSSNAVDSLKNKVRNDIDTVGGSGASDKIEGKAQKDVGTVQRKVGDLLDNNKNKFDGAGKEIQGSAKQTAGKAKDAVEGAASKVEQATDNAVDAVKDFFKR